MKKAAAKATKTTVKASPKKAAKPKEESPLVKANAFYEAESEAGWPNGFMNLARVEEKFGLKRYQLVNFRKGSPKAAVEGESATMAPRSLEWDIWRVVSSLSRTAGSVPVGWKPIAAGLSLPDSLEGQEWALKIFDAMVDRDIVAKGVLNRESEETKRILAAGEPVARAAVAPAPEGVRLITVPIENVVVCPLNPRKRIDEESIEEMADSILEHDIIQPPVARPGKYADTFEVVFGQRRLLGKRRAIGKAKEVKLPPIAATIQLLVREMDDRTVLEEAWVENLQRVDVGAREEAEGFQAMLDLRDEEGVAVYSIRTLAAKFGKKKSFVANRLKLKHVPEEMWAAMEAGKIGLRQMELVGSLPDEGARKKAAGMVLEPRYRTKEEPLTVRETVDLLKSEFMVSLRGCEWDLKDATLVAMKRDKKGERIFGGACEDCPFRAGSDPDLQESLSSSDGKRGKQGVDAKTCLLPTCYAAKEEAAWKRTMQEASTQGSKVLTEEEAKKVFASWGSGGVISHNTELVSLSESPGYYETGHHAGADTLSTWGKMIDLSKVDPKEITVGRSEHTGKVHVLLQREKAIELAEAGLGKKGRDSPFSNRPGMQKDGEPGSGGDEDEDDGDDSPSLYQLQRAHREKLEAAVEGKLDEAIDLQKTPAEEVITELILGTMWEEIGYQGGLMKHLLERGVPPFDDENGDDDEKAWAYLNEVVRPEIALAPLAWAARALYEMYDQLINMLKPVESDGLLRAMGLDRDAIVAAEDPEEDLDDDGEDSEGEED